MKSVPASLSTRDRVSGPKPTSQVLMTCLKSWVGTSSKCYSYEKYDGLSAEEYRARGAAWVEAGAELSAATFRYHPMELTALTESLQGLGGVSASDPALRRVPHNTRLLPTGV